MFCFLSPSGGHTGRARGEPKGRSLGSEPTLPSKVGLVMPRTAPVREYSLWTGLRVWLFYTHPVTAVLLFHVHFPEHTRTQGGMASHPRSPSKEMVIPGRPDSSPRLPSPLCQTAHPWIRSPSLPDLLTHKEAGPGVKNIKCKHQLAFIEGLLCAGCQACKGSLPISLHFPVARGEDGPWQVRPRCQVGRGLGWR